ncbi:MAG: hypothetical protein NTX63_03155 [Candidatus Peregrinibacteria bacterium]|nr:hypothetical protein [Candidatus Peregrinibacteria bacterium]
MKNTRLIIIASAVLLTIFLPLAAFGQTDTATTPAIVPAVPLSDAAAPKTKKDNFGQEMKKINMEKKDVKKTKLDLRKEIKKTELVKKTEKKIIKKEVKEVKKNETKKIIKKTKKALGLSKQTTTPAPASTPAATPAPVVTPATTPAQ